MRIRRAVLRRLFDAIQPYIARELSSLRVPTGSAIGSSASSRASASIEQRRGHGVRAQPTRSSLPASAPRQRDHAGARTLLHHPRLAAPRGLGCTRSRRPVARMPQSTAAKFSKLYGLDSPEFADARLFSAFPCPRRDGDFTKSLPDSATGRGSPGVRLNAIPQHSARWPLRGGRGTSSGACLRVVYEGLVLFGKVDIEAHAAGTNLPIRSTG